MAEWYFQHCATLKNLARWSLKTQRESWEDLGYEREVGQRRIIIYFLALLHLKYQLKRKKLVRSTAGTRRQQITLIFKIVMAITPMKTFQVYSRVLLSDTNCAKDIFACIITCIHKLNNIRFFFFFMCASFSFQGLLIHGKGEACVNGYVAVI